MTNNSIRKSYPPIPGTPIPPPKDPAKIEEELLEAVEALKDADHEVRQRASQTLIAAGDRRVADFLLHEMNCSNIEHRRRAYDGLGVLKDPRAVKPLIGRLWGIEKDNQVYHDDEAMVLGIIQSLGRIGDASAIQHLHEIAGGRVQRYEKTEIIPIDLRLAAMDALREAGETGLIEQLYDRVLQGDDGAIEFLVQTRDPNAVPLLLERLAMLQEEPDCPDNGLLDYLSVIDARADMIKWTNSDRRANVWNREFYPCQLIVYDIKLVIDSLGKLGDTRALEALIGRLDGSHSVAHAAANALAAIGDRRAVQPLIDAAQRTYSLTLSGGPRLVSYITALGKLGDPRALDLLLKIYQQTPNYAGALVGPFGNIGTKRVVDPILTILKTHSDKGVRQAAVKASDKIYTLDERVPEALIHALETDKMQEVRRDAATVLGKHHEVRAVDVLIKHFNEDRPKVQREAEKALKRIGTPKALAAIKP